VTTLRLNSTDPTEVTSDALIIGITRGGDGRPALAGGAPGVDKAFRGGLRSALRGLGATGRAEEVTKLASLGAIGAGTLIAVGLGDTPARGARIPADTLRRAAGAAARALAGTRSAATTLALVNGDTADVRPVAEGLLLGGYAFRRFRSAASAAQAKSPLQTATVLVDQPRDKAVRAAVDRANVVAESVVLCRDLVNTPPADLHPADLAAAARNTCVPLGLEVEILDEKALAKAGFGGILGVGQGSAHPPRLVRIAHRVDPDAPTIAIVGKGITFDSGGLSLKPAASMEWMKSDMGGAAAVIATLAAAARLELGVNVTGWVPTAENMPGGRAIRPSDVLTMYGGKTVEVLNTDAEGRLILADAIVRAGEERPDVIVDVATLTGAQLVALGSRTFAVMSNYEDLRDQLVAAADGAGEPAWAMPLPDYLRSSLDSEVADIANMGDRNGGMLVAGVFLRDFVPDGIRWAHLDIAGPAFNQGDPWGCTPKGGTGSAIRTLIDYLASVER